ncbi:MAG: polysaccharide deacetylase family protein [Planctomycetaceae bacterium]|nr:polysaccharide deacetylase family protein [Planctomycetaceae bacterium]
MPLWKQLLLSLYYHGTLPARWWTCRRLASRDRLPTVVLFWHRVADDRATPWTISNQTFARQVRWLAERFQFVSLAETQRRVREGCNRRPCVCVTFDDGYAENCDQAIPLLIRMGIPCTYFVTLRNVLDGQAFSHDLALGHRLAPNTLDQIRSMAASGIEIGAHTYTHIDLAAINDADSLWQEVVGAKEELQSLLHRDVRYLSFPFGQPANLTPEAFALARQAGYAGACSAYGGYNSPGDDPFHLQRIAVDDAMIHLKNWTTIDPRKLRTPRYQYQTPPCEASPRTLAARP